MKTSKAIVVISKEVKIFRKRKDAADYLSMTDNGLKLALQRNDNDYYRQDGTRVALSDVECPGKTYVPIKNNNEKKEDGFDW
jgi:hypothetical protein